MTVDRQIIPADTEKNILNIINKDGFSRWWFTANTYAWHTGHMICPDASIPSKTEFIYCSSYRMLLLYSSRIKSSDGGEKLQHFTQALHFYQRIFSTIHTSAHISRLLTTWYQEEKIKTVHADVTLCYELLLNFLKRWKLVIFLLCGVHLRSENTPEINL